MRKFFAWLGAATLVMVSLGTARAAGPTVLKPYIVFIMDVSTSMRDATGSGPPSCTDANGAALADTKLNHARCAVNNIVNTYGDIVFSLARFREDNTPRTDGAGHSSSGKCGTNGSAPTCDLSESACNFNSDRFELLTALDDHHCTGATTKQCLVNSDCGANGPCIASTNASTTASWANFICDTCTSTIGASGDPEAWNAFGATPIEGSIGGAECYWAGLNIKAGHCSNNAALSCETNSNCTGGGTCVYDPGCSSSSGFNVLPSTTPGYSPIANDPTDTKFLPATIGGVACNPSPACFALSIATATDSGSTATYTTVGTHGLKGGVDTVKITGVGVAGYNSTTTFLVASTPSATTFTVNGISGLAASGGGYVILSDTSKCCQTQCRPYITVVLSDGDETCFGSSGHCSATTTQPCNPADLSFAACPGAETCVLGSGHCSTTTATGCFLDGDCPFGEACVGAPTVESVAASMLHTVVQTSGTAKQYRVQTIPIGFGTTTVPYGPIENLAAAGGAIAVPGQNLGFYASDESSLELAISKIIESSVRSELCNGQDDDCDGNIDEDFPQIYPTPQACDNGQKGVCLGTGLYQCSSDGTGVVCNITTPGGTAQTTCPVGKTCSPDGTETCNDGLDNDCDGFVDEGCTTCTPVAELCNGHDDNCNGTIDEGIPTKQCGVFAGAACSPNAACCGTQVCAGPCVGQPSSCVGVDAYGACSASWTVVPELCNGIDDDCDGVVDEDLTKSCSSITGNGCAAAPCPGSNNPGDPGAYHCTGLKQACTGPADNSCPGGVACIPPIPENICHAGTSQCTGGTQGTCTGEVTPGVEICDGLDNDCDNIIDEDTGGGACNATCGVGTILCAGSPADPTCCQPGSCAAGQHQCGTLYCSAVSVTTDDTCNNMDDNCNGQVDEGWTCGAFRCQNAIQTECQGVSDVTTCGASDTCIANPSTPVVSCTCTGTGICNGKVKCVQGVADPATTCQGTPQDPSSCCDCGGTPNNGLCSGGASCAANCQCAYPCSGGEFPCPSGKKCDTSQGQPGLCVPDPCFGITCPTDPGTGNAQVCADQNGTGACVDACSQNANCPAPGTVPQCPAAGGVVCNPKTGACVSNDCTSFPSCCAANQNCVVDTGTGVGTCVTNLCAGVTCPSDQYCEQGNCVKSCSGVSCPSGQRCTLGACETDPCGHPCPSGQVCQDSTMSCQVDPCQFRNCPQGQWCNPHDGMCETDPCVGTMCPADPPGQICRGGTCYDPSAFGNDAGSHVTVAGGGCSTGDGAGAGAGLLLVLGAMVLRRRRTVNGGAL